MVWNYRWTFMINETAYRNNNKIGKPYGTGSTAVESTEK